MRRGLVVVSHPEPASFNHALARAVVTAWRETAVETELVDLHAMGFDPVLDRDEARGRLSRDPRVAAQIDKLKSSELLAVVHPNCWGAPPAMMKGWMDRVFAPGAAYAFAKGEDDGEAPVGLLRGKKALVLNTSNTSAEREAGAFGDPLERIWRDCLLGYCGFDRIDRRVFRIIATSREEERHGWIAEAADAARTLAD